MTRADLERAAETFYPSPENPESPVYESSGEVNGYLRIAYIHGRLDQAKEDARMAEDGTPLVYGDDWGPVKAIFKTRQAIANAIRKGVE